MSDVVDRVRAALARIPHRYDCENHAPNWLCTCDREERVAQAVARFGEEIASEVAKEMQANWWPKSGPTAKQEAQIKADAFEAGVAALAPPEHP